MATKTKKIRISTVAKKLDVSNTDVLHICRQELGIDPKAASSSITEEEAVAVGEFVSAEKARQDAVAEIEAEAVEPKAKKKAATEVEPEPVMSLVEALEPAIRNEGFIKSIASCYTAMSEQVATAETPGAKAYPSQQRTGMKKILVAMGVGEAVLKALDREIRLMHGGKK